MAAFAAVSIMIVALQTLCFNEVQRPAVSENAVVIKIPSSPEMRSRRIREVSFVFFGAWYSVTAAGRTCSRTVIAISIDDAIDDAIVDAVVFGTTWFRSRMAVAHETSSALRVTRGVAAPIVTSRRS